MRLELRMKIFHPDGIKVGLSPSKKIFLFASIKAL